MAKHGISTEDVYKDPRVLKDVVFDIAEEANGQYGTAKGMALPDGAWLGLLGGAAGTRGYLDMLQVVDFDLFDRRLTGVDWRCFQRIYRSYRARSI
jgi:hypothetical protein